MDEKTDKRAIAESMFVKGNGIKFVSEYLQVKYATVRYWNQQWRKSVRIANGVPPLTDKEIDKIYDTRCRLINTFQLLSQRLESLVMSNDPETVGKILPAITRLAITLLPYMTKSMYMKGSQSSTPAAAEPFNPDSMSASELTNLLDRIEQDKEPH